MHVVEAGIALCRDRGPWETAISCGLAGGLLPDLRTGTIVIPAIVGTPEGLTRACDADLVQALCRAARKLGFEPTQLPLLTVSCVLRGAARAEWAARGYAAADMETARIDADRIACVRVILDTPSREISPAWVHPARALLDPRAWTDLPFLAREGPRCARLAARVVVEASRLLGGS